MQHDGEEGSRWKDGEVRQRHQDETQDGREGQEGRRGLFQPDRLSAARSRCQFPHSAHLPPHAPQQKHSAGPSPPLPSCCPCCSSCSQPTGRGPQARRPPPPRTICPSPTPAASVDP
eukprot:407379-Hanusia_phi.AAC.1